MADADVKPSAPEVPAAPEAPGMVSEKMAAVSEKTAAVVDGIKGSLASISGKTMLIVSVALLTLVLGAVVGVIIYFLFKKLSVKINTYILPESKVPLNGTQYTRLKGTDIPRAYNGRRATISFWIYIHDINKYMGTYRHVLHRGDDSVLGASPLVFLDKASNKLHIRFDDIKTPTTELSIQKPFDANFKDLPSSSNDSGTNVTGTFTGKINDMKEALNYDLATHGITIDYIPLQRWVHVAVSVNEDVNGGLISAYIDGELVNHVQSNTLYKITTEVTGKLTTTTAGEATTGGEVTKSIPISITRKYDALNLDKSGDIYVGGDGSSNVGPGFSGLVAGVVFANYDLNSEDIYKIYLDGPVDNLAAKLGLPAYGVRAPVYRLA